MPAISTCVRISHGTLEPGVAGWAAHASPFTFETGPLRYAAAPERFQSGTPNVPALYSARAGYEIVAEIGVDAIREKSLRLTRRLMDRARSAGYRLNTPDADHERGGAVIVDVPNAEVVSQELLRQDVVIDYRPGAGIRMAPHFYNNEDDIDRAMRGAGRDCVPWEAALRYLPMITIRRIAVPARERWAMASPPQPPTAGTMPPDGGPQLQAGAEYRRAQADGTPARRVSGRRTNRRRRDG